MTGPSKMKRQLATVKRAKVIVAAPANAKKKRPRKNRSLFKDVGGMLGGMVGGSTGSAIGRTAGSLVARITGFGDYKVARNSIVSGNSVPSFRTDSDGMVVCHREFLRDIKGTVGFALESFSINPGLSNSFPLLSLLSQIFEEYEMVGLVYEYRPTSGTAVSSMNPALGVVILATDYDAANPLFINKQQMESYEFSTSTVPFNGCLHAVECKRGLNVLDNQYVRSTFVPPGTDVRLYDLGNLQVATQGMQMNGAVMGELWVSYDVRLRKPRLPSLYSDPSTAYMRVITRPAATASDQLLFGTGPPFAYVTPDSNLTFFGVSVANRSVSVVFKKKGIYIFQLDVSSTTMAGPAYTFDATIGSNLTGAPAIFRGNTNSGVNTASFNSACQKICITVADDLIGTSTSNTLTLVVSAGFTFNTANVDMIVWRLGFVVPLLDPVTPSLDAPMSRLTFDHIDIGSLGLSTARELGFTLLDDEKTS